jgi:hypothetical protein
VAILYKTIKEGKTMRTKIILLLMVLLILTGCELHRSNPITVRTPTEQELLSFNESRGIKALAIKYYKDYAIILGDSSIYSLSITSDDKQQYLGSSWNGAPERIDVIAVTQETPFIEVIIHRNDVIEQGKKLKAIFEDNSTVEITMNHEKAFIVDHPLGKLTNSSKAKVQIFNNKDEVVYQNY